ncbi:cyclic nucleotide-binding domain-containing protein [Cohnella nanjingensis]|uniref:Cyclic nucleotide-binding domain-containing protein n=1 Tax=Cohnella nanjingensis TaxID=1387779 RepID=A0A7X0RRJ9_9BACL|nr:cyclic nucleotide-binding domain-containing protein [Cohnella nanjingensis]
MAFVAESDRIFVLEQGRVAESGTHGQLMASQGLYRRMWDKQHGFALSKSGHAQVEGSRLGRLPFFREIEPIALQEISRLFVTERFEAGVPVVEQGEEGDKFYIIVRGKVDVVVGAEERKKVAVLEDGDHFGEIALMHNVPRTASIVTQSPCICLALEREDFLPLLTRFPSICESLEHSLRIRNQRSAAL